MTVEAVFLFFIGISLSVISFNVRSIDKQLKLLRQEALSPKPVGGPNAGVASTSSSSPAEVT